LNDILHATDHFEPALALEASHDILSKVGAPYFVRRSHQYALSSAIALLADAATLIAGLVLRRRRLLAIGVGWLLILIVASALQFGAASIGSVVYGLRPANSRRPPWAQSLSLSWSRS